MQNRNRIGYAFLVCALVAPAATARAQVLQGMTLYGQRCGSCHDHPAADSRAPDRTALSQRTPESILDAITTGVMKDNATGLTDTQKRVLAEQLTGRPIGGAQAGQASAMTNRCPATPFRDPAATPMWSGWGADPGNSRFQPNPGAGMTPDGVSKLTLKWAFAFPGGGSAYGQPAVAGGRIFVGSDNGFVYAIDAKSGCVYWSFQAQAGVRTAVSVGALGKTSTTAATRFAAYFGDLKGNVYAVDAESGALVWTKHTDAHPLARVTGAPVLSGGRLFVPVASLEEGAGSNPKYECCTFRGAVVAYDATTGSEIWKAYTIPEAAKPTKKNSAGTQLWGPAGAAVWSSPTVDAVRNILYVGTGNSYVEPAAATTDSVLALDLATGRLLWSRQVLAADAYIVGCGQTAAARDNCPTTSGPDFDFGSSPILRPLPNGKSVIVIGQKSGIEWAVDPDREGAILWQEKVGQGSSLGGIEWGSAADNDYAYVPTADAQFGATVAGGLFALKLSTGERVWAIHPSQEGCTNPRGCVASRSAAISVIPGVVFSGTTDGMMRAYAASDGHVLWEYNTSHDYTTVNGIPGKGGSINGPGPVVAGGMLYTNSGYAYMGTGVGGNVLLAFGTD
jgi:polyvinyl alcohol dehydrogenase (cytochrome)